MLRMVSYPRRPQSGQITCYLNRTYHVLPTAGGQQFACFGFFCYCSRRHSLLILADGWLAPRSRGNWLMTRFGAELETGEGHELSSLSGRSIRRYAFLQQVRETAWPGEPA